KSLESEVTPPEVYFNRRAILRAGAIAAGAVGTGILYRKLNGVEIVDTRTAELSGVQKPADPTYAVAETKTPYESITNYNNFYEFTTNKDGVAKAAAGFSTAGWKVSVEGLVHKPKVFDLDDVRRISAPEERIYRMRCVEAWSMVVPWAGYSLSKLLAVVEPMASAKYVAFETLLDPARMPGQRSSVLDWPYVEGLRIDEAMHPLALLTTGLYGRELPPQDGAPVRMIIPWKYGFKGIKSIVKITLVDKQPPTSWNRYAPDEYGFYANVNPNHPHPRWSQATEQRIGESGRRKTLVFNGYADQVASLYAGMDLDVHF
ncbi:MAG TPA: protein-methionine-sulfoxide reductase catalytic subunit MsrP, partial [Kofleriaceae bacterium]|nr:protein-methionine-sulfoxide reductase catalytic subunit MsrP [Kofleriaceae bacterium]